MTLTASLSEGCSRQTVPRPSKDAAQCCADSDASFTDAGVEDAGEDLDGGFYRSDGSLDAQANRFCFPDGSLDQVGDALPAITGAAPTVKWVKKAAENAARFTKHLVMSRDAVALPLTDGLAIYQKASGEFKYFSHAGAELFDDVVATEDGAFLLAGRSVYAISEQGTLVWSLPLSAAAPIENENAECRLEYSRKLRTLIAVCNEGWMYGVKVGERGEVLWRKQVYSEGALDVSPAPSVGESSLWYFPSRHEVSGTWVVDPNSGERTGLFSPPSNVIFSKCSQGLLARSTGTATLLDRCGGAKWLAGASDGNQVPLIVGVPDEDIFMLETGADGARHLGVISSHDGHRLAGPTATGTPAAAGADGTFYAVTCDNVDSSDRSTVVPELVAYDATLREKSRLTLPVPSVQGLYSCPRPAVALDDDGVMYLAVAADGTYLMAVQTASPGLAATAWPLRFGGHAGDMGGN
jgi:hypothetical protein